MIKGSKEGVVRFSAQITNSLCKCLYTGNRRAEEI